MDALQRTRDERLSGVSARDFFTAPFRVATYRNLLYLLLQFPLGIAYFTALVTAGAVGIAGIVAVFTAVPAVVNETVGMGVPLLGLLLGLSLLGLTGGLLVVLGLIGATLSGVDVYTVDRLISKAVIGRLSSGELPRAAVRRSITEELTKFLRSYLLTPGTYVSTLVVLAKSPIGVALFILLFLPLSIATAFLATPLALGSSLIGLNISIPGVFESGFVEGVYTIDGEFFIVYGAWIVDTVPEALLS